MIKVEGDFDFSQYHQFRVLYQNASNITNYILDLTDTQYLDSSALALIASLHQQAIEQQAGFKLIHNSSSVEKILKVSGALKLFSA